MSIDLIIGIVLPSIVLGILIGVRLDLWLKSYDRFCANKIRDMSIPKPDFKKTIRETNKMIKTIAKDKWYTTQNYHIEYDNLLNQIGANSITKFKRYYINRGFEVYITDNILYISWER